ncbi:MAG: hypothetical protein ACYTHK_14555 [Planctomycetota bacterium]|jgi:hypothetical protein
MKQFRGQKAAWLVAMFVLCAASAAAAAGKHSFDVVDRTAIYYGSGKHPKAPAVCDADDVWGRIPEYQTIVADELTASDPRYHLLLKKATKRFQRALRKLARRDSYDMIGEIGSIKAVGKKSKSIPTVTKDLIELVGRD